jgi:hypothetical protein
LGQHHVLLSYKMQDECVRKNFNTNPYIAAFTTAHARLRLYKMLQMLGNRVCYCDTDSVIYISDDKTEQAIKSMTGDQLGQWDIDKVLKDKECKGKVNYIVRLVCVAPKDYGFILSNGEYVGKTKGLRVNAEFEALSTFESRVKLVRGEESKIAFSHQKKFSLLGPRAEHRNGIVVEQIEKEWGPEFNKRVACCEEWEPEFNARVTGCEKSANFIDTYPFGF